jgi:hypothetical protein
VPRELPRYPSQTVWRPPTPQECTDVAIVTDDYHFTARVASLVGRYPSIRFVDKEDTASQVLFLHKEEYKDVDIPDGITEAKCTDLATVDSAVKTFLGGAGITITFDVRNCSYEAAKRADIAADPEARENDEGCVEIMHALQRAIANADPKHDRMVQTNAENRPKWVFLFAKEATREYNVMSDNGRLEKRGVLSLHNEWEVRRDVARALRDTDGQAIIALVVRGALTSRNLRGPIFGTSYAGEAVTFQYDEGLDGSDINKLAAYLRNIERDHLWPTDPAFRAVKY